MSTKMAIIKRKRIDGEDVKKLEPPCTAGGNVNGMLVVKQFGRQLDIFCNIDGP